MNQGLAGVSFTHPTCVRTKHQACSGRYTPPPCPLAKKQAQRKGRLAQGHSKAIRGRAKRTTVCFMASRPALPVCNLPAVDASPKLGRSSEGPNPLQSVLPGLCWASWRPTVQPVNLEVLLQALPSLGALSWSRRAWATCALISEPGLCMVPFLGTSVPSASWAGVCAGSG